VSGGQAESIGFVGSSKAGMAPKPPLFLSNRSPTVDAGASRG